MEGLVRDWREEQLKPYWLIKKEEERDNRWLEGGVYEYKCEHCGEITKQHLKAVKTYRHTAPCAACGKEVEL